MKAIADAHAAQAAGHTADADNSSAAAAAHGDVAAAAEKALQDKRDYRLKNGLLDDEEWEEDVMSERDHIFYGDDENDYEEGDDENERSLKAARRTIVRDALGIVEQRADDGKVRTKTVGGKHLSAASFAFVGDPNDTSTWKFPVHDKAHADNALARWGQAKGIPSDKKEAVHAKIVAAAKKFGTEVSEPDARSEKETIELRLKAAMLSTEVRG